MNSCKIALCFITNGDLPYSELWKEFITQRNALGTAAGQDGENLNIMYDKRVFRGNTHNQNILK